MDFELFSELHIYFLESSCRLRIADFSSYSFPFLQAIFQEFGSRFHTLATWCKELTHLKRPWCWERLRAGGEGDDRRWDGWMASVTQWIWVWMDSGSWWTGRPGVLRFMGSQRVGHDWATELNWYSKHHCDMCVCVCVLKDSFRDKLKDSFRGIPRGPVVRILSFHCLDQGFYSWLGN